MGPMDLISINAFAGSKWPESSVTWLPISLLVVSPFISADICILMASSFDASFVESIKELSERVSAISEGPKALLLKRKKMKRQTIVRDIPNTRLFLDKRDMIQVAVGYNLELVQYKKWVFV